MASSLHQILVVGVGSIGERHVRCFQTTRRAHVSICDANDTQLHSVAERYDIQNAFRGIDEALTNTFDAVVIATPAHLHVPMAIQAAQAGCHLLIEKPLSVDLTGVDELLTVIEATQRNAMVAYVMRSHPALSAMRNAIRTGRFGEPVHLYATCGQHFPTYRPAYRDIYYRDRSTGGGAIQDALTHVINAAEWLVGPVDRLVADAEHQVLPGVEVEDTVNVLARHGRVLASYAYNQHQAPNELTITVVCDRGTARFEYHLARWSWLEKPDTPWENDSLTCFERDTIFVHQANTFLDALEGKQPPPCTVLDAARTLKVNLAVIQASTDKSQWVQLSDGLN
jgi:predicted dehydrogenase